jgi:hypothetical protein
MLLRREHVQTVNGLMQPGRTAADKRNPAASTTRSWHIEFTPTSALGQLGMLVQSGLPSGDDTLARFKQNIVPQLEAAYNFARFLSRDADAPRTSYRRHFFELIEASLDIVAGMRAPGSLRLCVIAITAG